MTQKKVVILGAGLAGLTAGWVLARAGYEVLILEREAGNGGLAVTRQRGAYRYDLGPHNIHTTYRHVLHFLGRELEGLFQHSPFSKVYKYGKWVSYPLRGIKVLTSLPYWKIPIATASFFLARVRAFLTNPRRDADFEGWIERRFGRVLCREYFSGYAEKVWRIPADQIDSYVAEKRVPILNLTELIRAVFFGKAMKIDHPEFLDENWYIPNGIGEIPEYFERGFLQHGGRIVNRATPVKVVARDGRVTGVVYRTEQNETSTDEAPADYVLSTIPLPSLITLFDPGDEQARAAAAKLDYCACVLLFLAVRRTQILPSPMVYFSEADVPFSRVSDFREYSARMVPAGCSLLCVEFPCNKGDETWRASVDELSRICIDEFVKANLLQPDDVEDRFIEQIEHSYPRFRLGFRAHLEACLAFLRSFDNLVTFGRQGRFCYINTDTVMEHAFHAADAVLTAHAKKFRCHEWFDAVVVTH